MANTYQTTIVSLQSYQSYEGQTDCVWSINWAMSGTDGKGNNGVSYGTTDVPYDANEAFIPYADLTQDQVMSWWNEYTQPDAITAARASIDQQIDAASNPVTQELPLPWVTP